MNGPLPSTVKADQLSVFLENRSGSLASAVHAVAAAGVDLRGISLADTSDFGILRMITSDVIRAEAALKGLGLTTGKTIVVGVEMADEPGSLDNVLQVLSARGINVEYMYAVAGREPGKVAMVFRFDKVDKAIQTLGAMPGISLIPAQNLG